MTLQNIEICPVCHGNLFVPFLTCIDYTTSQETFSLKQCVQCTFVITSPRPDENSLPKYYDSDRYISHTGKAYALFDSLYLFVRRFTLRWKTSLIKHYKKEISILDYGCGTGEFLRACNRLGWQTSGVEPSDIAKSNAKNLSRLNIRNSLTELNGETFDVITLWHVLEHVPDLKEKLAELKGLLKDNGMLFVAVPNNPAYDAAVYQQYWAGFDVPRHLWHFSQATMKTLLADAGFIVQEIRPMKLDAYYVSLLSQKYKSGRYSAHGIITALTTALLSNRKAKPEMNYSSLLYIATR